MKYYYTTSSGQNEIQPKPALSLGGFRANSPILNDEFANLFDEITSYTITKNKNEYIALMLRNETGEDKTNLQLWVTHPEDAYSKYQVAGVIPTVDGDGNPYIERIETRTSKPFYVDFEDAEETSKYDLGDLVDEGQLGIWIKRELLLDLIEEAECDVYEDDPENPRRFKEKIQSLSDSINIELSWD